MATKLKVNYEFVGDSTTPVTRTESIKHGDSMLSAVINAAAATVNTKADKTYVDTELAKKANAADVTTALSGKADNTTVSALDSRVGTAETNIATQTARIDEIASLPEGSTTGDAELIDIRVGADGKTYTSAGNAVRGQISDVKGEFDALLKMLDVKDFSDYGTLDGKYYYQNTIQANSQFKSILWFSVKENDIIKYENVTSSENANFITALDGNGNYVESASIGYSSEFVKGIYSVPEGVKTIGISYLTNTIPSFVHYTNTNNILVRDIKDKFTLTGFIDVYGNYNAGIDYGQTSVFIPKENFDKIHLNGYMGSRDIVNIAFYKKDNSYLSDESINYTGGGFPSYDVDIPSDAYYIRCSVWNVQTKLSSSKPYFEAYLYSGINEANSKIENKINEKNEDINKVNIDIRKLLNFNNSINISNYGKLSGKYYYQNTIQTNSQFDSVLWFSVKENDIIKYENVTSSEHANFITALDSNGNYVESASIGFSSDFVKGLYSVPEGVTAIGISYLKTTNPTLVHYIYNNGMVAKNIEDKFTLSGMINAVGIYDTAIDYGKTTGYISRENYDSIHLMSYMGSSDIVNIAFYTKSKEFIANSSINFRGNGFPSYDVDIPINCCYIRCSVWNTTKIGGDKAYISAYLYSKLSKVIEESHHRTHKGITWNAVGDSLTATWFDLYVSYVADKTKMIANNHGVGGSCVAEIGSTEYPSFVSRVLGTHGQTAIPDADYWTIFGGTNDAGNVVPIGTIDDVVETTFYGALNLICANIIQRSNHPDIVLITPYWLKDSNSSPYVEAMINIGKKYGIPVIDLYRNSGINSLNYSYYIRDAVHPNQNGADKLRPLLLKEISNAALSEITPDMPH